MLHDRRLLVPAAAAVLLVAASCRRPAAVPSLPILSPITAVITDETRREAMVSVYAHAADVVGDEVRVIELDDAAKLLAADVGTAAAERRRRAAIARLAATGVEEHRSALEILGAPTPEIVDALNPYPMVPDWFREAVVQNLLTLLWGPVTKLCLSSAPIWHVSRTGNEVTVTVRLQVNRTAAELGPVLDPQEWDRCSIFFPQAYVAEEEAEPDEPIEIPIVARADERTHPARVDGGVPAGFFEHHVQVVGISERPRVVAPPTDLDGLTFDGLATHAFGFFQHQHSEAGAQRRPIVDEGAQAEQREGVAHVDRDGYPVQCVEGGTSAAAFAFVLDIVVNEERVVEQLEGSRGAHGPLHARAEHARRCDAEARAEHATSTTGVVGDQAVEMTLGIAWSEVVGERHTGDIPILPQHRGDGSRCTGTGHRRPGFGIVRTALARQSGRGDVGGSTASTFLTRQDGGRLQAYRYPRDTMQRCVGWRRCTGSPVGGSQPLRSVL